MDLKGDAKARYFDMDIIIYLLFVSSYPDNRHRASVPVFEICVTTSPAPLDGSEISADRAAGWEYAVRLLIGRAFS